jgi:DNA-binding transcriptional LysR family regulator
MEFGTLDGLLGCIAAGMGVSLLPRSIVERPQHMGQIEALAIPDARVDTWMIQHEDTVETGAMRAFRALISARAEVPAAAAE